MGIIDWEKVRKARVPKVAENDPILADLRAQLKWLDSYPIPDGNGPMTGKTSAELHRDIRQILLDEIECYRWQKACFLPTPEMLDACRDENGEFGPENDTSSMLYYKIGELRALTQAELQVMQRTHYSSEVREEIE